MGIDHERFLLAPEENAPEEPLARIAFEKAGIAKPGVPLVTLSYSGGAALEIERAAIAREALQKRVCPGMQSERTSRWRGPARSVGLRYAGPSVPPARLPVSAGIGCGDRDGSIRAAAAGAKA